MDVLAQLRTSLASRYTLQREIGRGGMATVYLARDVRHGRNVAVKVLNPELGAVLGVERFLSEIQVTANLQHPNLLPLFDSGEVDGMLFYVMPWVEGESLRARLRREKQLPVDEAIQLAVAIAGALQYAHRRGVIHRDLKPENILLHEGQPLVADFGIALAVSAAGGERITQTGISLGTPHYMSPEQATGDRVIDERSDVYSLAAVLYECLTGDPPHTASTAQAIIAKVLTDEPRSVRATRPHVPPHVEAAIARALEKLPADRWKTAQEFAEALQGRSAPGTALPRRPRAILRSPIPWAVAFAVAAGAAGIAFWKLAALRGEGAPESVRFLLEFPERTRMFQGAGAGKTLAISKDGRRVAYAAFGPAGTGVARRLVVRSIDDVTPRILEGTEGASQPSFSPDGNWIAFVVGQELRKVRVDGGAVQALADVGGQFGIDWAAPERIVVATGEALVHVPAEGGPPQRITGALPFRGNLRWPRVLHDGRTAIVTMWSGAMVSARLAAISLDDGSFDSLQVAGTSALGMRDGHLIYASASANLQAIPFDLRRKRTTGPPIIVADRVSVGGTGAAIADLSRNGTLTYQSGSAVANLTVVDATGASRPVFGEARAYAQPRYSPDGKRIAVAVGSIVSSDVHIYDIAAGTLTRLTTEGIVNDRPEWTPDGRRVLFRSERDAELSLWWRPADNSGPAELLLRVPDRNAWEGVLTPDGATLVYRTGTLGSADIWARRLTGDTTPVPIATSSFTEWCARVSPDGRVVAYSGDDSRIMEVYVRPMPPRTGRVQVSSGGGNCSVWSRDGRTLYYANNQAFYAATITTSPALAVTSRRKLFESDFTDTPGHPNYDVAPNGEILFVKPTMSTDQVIVVHNWAAELRQRLARATAAGGG